MRIKVIAWSIAAATVMAAVGVVIAVDLTSGARLTASPPPAARAPAPWQPDPGSHPIITQIGSNGARLIIPALDIDAPLIPAGATGVPGAATLTVPADIHTVVWWDGVISDGAKTAHVAAPAPGEHGVAVIAGHVDSTAGPGALYKLSELTPGDTIAITGSNGRSSRWTVIAPPETALKTQLPPALWVTSGPPKLALVTCGGPFDPATGHYLDNVIVWAEPATASAGNA
jgi:hypothetical protein